MPVVSGAAPATGVAAPVTPVDVNPVVDVDPVADPIGPAPVTGGAVKEVCAVKEIRISSSGMAGPGDELALT
jgi:hypothetical protein